ncbi:hypothetical protein V8E53_012037 [Lactarius tabidus]
MSREGKDPPNKLPSERGDKMLQEMKGNLLLQISEQKIDMNTMRDDVLVSAANLDVRAEAEDDAWTTVGQFYNDYQESVTKAKDKQHANPEDDLKISELPEQFCDMWNLAQRILAKDATAGGGHNLHRHRWSKLVYKVRS